MASNDEDWPPVNCRRYSDDSEKLQRGDLRFALPANAGHSQPRVGSPHSFAVSLSIPRRPSDLHENNKTVNNSRISFCKKNLASTKPTDGLTVHESWTWENLVSMIYVHECHRAANAFLEQGCGIWTVYAPRLSVVWTVGMPYKLTLN
jgi:hypothetical protein